MCVCVCVCVWRFRLLLLFFLVPLFFCRTWTQLASPCRSPSFFCFGPFRPRSLPSFLFDLSHFICIVVSWPADLDVSFLTCRYGPLPSCVDLPSFFLQVWPVIFTFFRPCTEFFFLLGSENRCVAVQTLGGKVSADEKKTKKTCKKENKRDKTDNVIENDLNRQNPLLSLAKRRIIAREQKKKVETTFGDLELNQILHFGSVKESKVVFF